MPANTPHSRSLVFDGDRLSDQSRSSNPNGFHIVSATHLIHHRCHILSPRRVEDARQAGQLPPRRHGLDAGWLIANERINALEVSDPLSDSFRYLQIATGQWGSPLYATWFPVRSAAVLYAADLGREVSRSIQIIFLRRDRRSDASVS